MNENIICWFEIYVANMDRAKKFYQEVLGTNFQDATEMPDVSAQFKMSFFSNPENQGVNGALIEMEGAKEGKSNCVNTMVYFPCMDCSVQEQRVVPAGGKVIRSKFSLGQFGFSSICEDSEGNPFGLYSME